MRLLLHIGSGKTGTSTLQRTLKHESDALARRGILYPNIAGAESHRDIMCSFLAPDRLPRGFGALRTRPTVRDIGDAFWAEVDRQIARFEPQVVILSSEHLYSCTVEQLEELREILRGRFSDIDVIAYIRHPASHYLSLVQQKVKAAHAIPAPGRYRTRTGLQLSRHMDAFGRVSVRAFDRGMLHSGCIVHDFFCTYVPKGDELIDLITVRNANESMSAEAMCIIQRLRRDGWPDQDDEFAPESNRALLALHDIEGGVPHVTPKLKPSIRAGLTASHDDELDWLEEHFGLIFPSARETMPDPVPAEWMSQDLMEILVVERDAIDFMSSILVKELAARALEGHRADARPVRSAVPARAGTDPGPPAPRLEPSEPPVASNRRWWRTTFRPGRA